MRTGERPCICFVNNFFMDFILLDRKQVQAKACMSDLMCIIDHSDFLNVQWKYRYEPPPPSSGHICWSESYVCWLPRSLVKSSQTPRYPRVFSFRKDTISIHRLTKEDKGPSHSSIAQSTENMLSLTYLSMLKVGYNSIYNGTWLPYHSFKINDIKPLEDKGYLILILLLL